MGVQVVHKLKRVTIQDTFMNTSQQVKDLIRAVDTGVLPVGERAGMQVAGKFALQDWEEAFNTAAANVGAEKAVYFMPNLE